MTAVRAVPLPPFLLIFKFVAIAARKNDAILYLGDVVGKEWSNLTKKLSYLASARQGWLEVTIRDQDPFGVRP